MDQHRIYAGLPLNENAFSTRLLTILPGSGDDPLVCRLRSVDINAYATYDALSYTWGELHDKGMIIVNSDPFPVTINLEDALRALRLSDRPRKLWVDAICINQADLQEKATQIPGMGQIYRNAHRVIVWLGKGSKDTDYAINVANASPDTFGLRLPEWLETGKRQGGWNYYSEHFPEDLSFSEGLEDLLFRPWWFRVWVVQEIAMAYSDPLIVCGNASVSWRLFLACIKKQKPYSSVIGVGEHISLNPDFYKIRTFMARWDQPDSLDKMRSRVQRPPSLRHYSVIRDNLTLLEDDFFWIGSTWMFKAHDPRDKLYALLGLTRGPLGKSIRIDYTIPPGELIVEIMHTSVEIHQSLDLLILCNPHEGQSSPSWLPDLDAEGSAGLPAIRPAASSNDPFFRYLEAEQSIDEETSIIQSCSIDWDVNLLRSTGRGIGIVSRVHGPGSDLYRALTYNQHNRDSIWRPCVAQLENNKSELMESFPAELHHASGVVRLSKGVIGVLKIALGDLVPPPHPLYAWKSYLDWLHEEEKAATVHFYWEPLLSRLRMIYHTDAGNTEAQLTKLEQPVTMTASEQLDVRAAAGEERIWFTTDTGLIGLGPPEMVETDEVVMFHASSFAFVLRAGEIKHSLIGQALVCPPRQLPAEFKISGVDHPMDYPIRWKEPISRTYVLE